MQEVHFNNPITGEKITEPARPNGIHPAPASSIAYAAKTKRKAKPRAAAARK